MSSKPGLSTLRILKNENICVKMAKTKGAKDITDFVRGRVISLRESGLSFRKIADKFNIDEKSARNIVNQHLIGQTSAKTRPGRPKKVKEDMQSSLLDAIKCNRRARLVDLTNKSNLDRRTIKKRLNKAGYMLRTPRNKPLLTPFQIKRRFSWSIEMIKKHMGFWKRVIFSDEKRFAQFDDGGNLKIWRQSDEANLPECTRKTVKHSPNTMVWGAIWFYGKSDLIFIDENMNADKYIQVLQEGLIPIIKTYSSKNLIFMEDGAPPHRALKTSNWKAANGITTLKWPGQSPDQNPIENLWGNMQKRYNKVTNKPTNLQELKSTLLELWTETPQDYIQKLIFTMPKRVQELYSNKGRSTHY